MFFKAKVIYALVLFCIFISSMELIEEEPNDENNNIKVINLTEMSNAIELNNTSPIYLKFFLILRSFLKIKILVKNFLLFAEYIIIPKLIKILIYQ